MEQDDSFAYLFLDQSGDLISEELGGGRSVLRFLLRLLLCLLKGKCQL